MPPDQLVYQPEPGTAHQLPRGIIVKNIIFIAVVSIAPFIFIPGLSEEFKELGRHYGIVSTSHAASNGTRCYVDADGKYICCQTYGGSTNCY